MACWAEIDASRARGVPDARSDEVTGGGRGACAGCDEPVVVAIVEGHSWGECWTGAER